MKTTLSLRLTFLLAAVALTTVGTGCGSTLAQPFGSLKGQPVTVYRLQNWEPPPAAVAAVPGAPALPFAVPPEIQTWISAGASMLPPGMIPPGLIPGTAPGPATDPNVARFHNFRILGWMAVTDTKQQSDILDLLGHTNNFTAPRAQCMYAEFGISIGQQGGPTPPDDLLVSVSCGTVQPFNFNWPYGGNNSLTKDSENRVIAQMRTAFGS